MLKASKETEQILKKRDFSITGNSYESSCRASGYEPLFLCSADFRIVALP